MTRALPRSRFPPVFGLNVIDEGPIIARGHGDLPHRTPFTLLAAAFDGLTKQRVDVHLLTFETDFHAGDGPAVVNLEHEGRVGHAEEVGENGLLLSACPVARRVHVVVDDDTT